MVKAGLAKWRRLGLSHQAVGFFGVVGVALSGPFPVGLADCQTHAN